MSIQVTQSGSPAPVLQEPCIGISGAVGPVSGISSSEHSSYPALFTPATDVHAERGKHAREMRLVCDDELKGRVRIFACDHSMHDHCPLYYWQTYYKDMTAWMEKKVGLYEKRLKKVFSESRRGIILIDEDASAFANSLLGLDYVKTDKPCSSFNCKETGP